MTTLYDRIERVSIEIKARAFLERSRALRREMTGPYLVDGDEFERIVQREVDLTIKQRRALARAAQLSSSDKGRES